MRSVAIWGQLKYETPSIEVFSVFSLAYQIPEGPKVYATYGDFKGDGISSEDAHVSELNLGAEYKYNDKYELYFYYVNGKYSSYSSKLLKNLGDSFI